MKIYTKTGDGGSSSLWSGKRVKKDHPRLEAYGSLDELNASIGLLLAHSENELVDKQVIKTQSHLFLIGSYLACDKRELGEKLHPITMDMAKELEDAIDVMEEDLDALTGFILPGGTKAAAYAHVCRVICRRAERNIVSLDEIIMYKEEILQYINRLSDYFFVVSRYLNKVNTINDNLWQSDLFKK